MDMRLIFIGDSIVAGDAFGRVRAMLNERGENVTSAGPAQPVQVLGFTSVPGAGDNFLVVGEDRVARQIAELPPAERNMTRMLFLEPRVRGMHRNWHEVASVTVWPPL